MSWRSTALYYERLNRVLQGRLGPHHGFHGHIWNLDYAELLTAADGNQWARVEEIIVDAARGLAQAGCDAVVLTAVTAHRFHEAVARESRCAVPHVLDGVARKLDELGIRRAGILGTAATCGAGFVREYLDGTARELLFLEASQQRGLDALIQGVLTVDGDLNAGRGTLRNAVRSLTGQGAQAVVLACTELPLLLPLDETGVPLIDAVALHVDEICELMLGRSHAE
jgi:aspartate racemase